MKTSVQMTITVLSFALIGCDFSISGDHSSSGRKDETNRLNMITLADKPGRWNKKKVERFLESGLGAVPVSNRYAFLTESVRDLWMALGPNMTNDIEYTLCMAARLQKLVDTELATVTIPAVSKSIGPVYHGVDGTAYRITTHESARQFQRETCDRENLRMYLEQMKHFSQHNPNRIDSMYFKKLFSTLDEGEKMRVWNRVVKILGREPQWSPDLKQ